MNRRRIVVAISLVLVLVVAPAALGKKVIPDVTGTRWHGEGKFRVGITGERPQKGPGEIDIVFGPREDVGSGQFVAGFGDSEGTLSFPGTWEMDAKGRPVLDADFEVARNQLLTLLEETLGGLLPGMTLDLQVVKGKLKAKPRSSSKTGDSLRTKGTFRARLTVSYQGKTRKGILTIAFKGTATPVE
jgi:hypothetical protein